MANKYWVGGSGTWGTTIGNWSFATSKIIQCVISGTTLTITSGGSITLAGGTTIWNSANTIVGKTVAGSKTSTTFTLLAGAIPNAVPEQMTSALATASVPLTIDNVFINEGSGLGEFTIEKSSALSIPSVDMSMDNINCTFNISANLTIADFTYNAGKISVSSIFGVHGFTSTTSSARTLTFTGAGELSFLNIANPLLTINTLDGLIVPNKIPVTFPTTYAGYKSTINIGSSPGISDKFSFTASGGAGNIVFVGNTLIDSLYFLGSFSGALINSLLSINGNLTLTQAMYFDGGGLPISFVNKTNVTQIITTNNNTTSIDCPINFNGGDTTTFSIIGDFNCGNRNITFTKGILNLNGYNVICGSFLSNNSNVRQINSTSNTHIKCYLTEGTTFDVGGANLVVTPIVSPFINVDYAYGSTYTNYNYFNFSVFYNSPAFIQFLF